ncbi:MAG: alpha/beta fold hydrolase [Myxococcota bacterium]
MTPLSTRTWPGDDPPVVLLHGAGGNRDTLGRLGEALAERGIGVLAPSLPGRGGSAGPPCATASEAAERVAALIEARGLGRPLVLGHSFGGAVALELGARQGERLGGLVLVATGARLRVHPDILRVMGEAAASGRPAEAGDMAWRPGTDPALREEAAEIAARTPPETALADWRAADAFDRMGELSAVRVPALVVGGTEDVLTPVKYARYLADHLPDARLELLDGEGHMLPMERPERLAAVVARFRGELGAR